MTRQLTIDDADSFLLRATWQGRPVWLDISVWEDCWVAELWPAAPDGFVVHWLDERTGQFVPGDEYNNAIRVGWPTPQAALDDAIAAGAVIA